MFRKLCQFDPPPTPLQQQLNPPPPDEPSRSSSNLSTCILVVGIILAVVFFVSGSLHIFLRYLSGFSGDDDENDDVASNEPSHVPPIDTRRLPPEENRSLIDSLPLFSFNSISGFPSSSSADCAVCLSKFEPHDQLRLLPLCCHAFHSSCIDTWLGSNQTCPLCRSNVHVDGSEGYLKLLSSSDRSESFSVEIGNVSSRRIVSDSGTDRRRSYSIGSFEYLVEDETSQVVVQPTHSREVSDSVFGGKKDDTSSPPVIEPGFEVGGGGGWLKEYVDRLASSSGSSSTLSFRLSGRLCTGSSRRSNSSGVSGVVNAASWDLEGNQNGSFLRWLSGE